METKASVVAVEVVLSWQGTVLDSEVLKGECTALRAGPEGARFLLPAEIASESFVIVRKDGERFVLDVPAGWTCRRADGAVESASSLALDTLETIELGK